jgi:hypothetical protein
MAELCRRTVVSLSAFFTLAFTPVAGVFAQQAPHFTPGNLVVVVEGCGVHRGTCTSVPNGTGNGVGNSSTGGYGDNQAAPLTLFQYTPSGTSSVTFVNSLALPQSAENANFPVSSEYGSSSEGTVQLSGAGQYLTLMGYGIDAPTFDAAYAPPFTLDPYGAAPSGALAQSGSLTGQSYTPIPRVIGLVDAYGNVNSATALYNIFNTNNPRSIYTADGVNAYVSGQGSGCDLTGGVFYVPLGTTNTVPTAITGGDAPPTSTCVASGYTGTVVAQDTRTVQIYNNTLYISMDSKEGTGDNRSLIGTLGTPPNTTLFTGNNSSGQVGPGNTGPLSLSNFGNMKTGKVTITTGAHTNGNNLNNSTTKVNGAALNAINLSPSNYFFASPSVLYIADTGNPKNDSNGDNNSSGATNIGNGGLQKWVNSNANGTGTWSLAYTLYQGLNLVNNGGTSGTTGLYGLTGVVSGTSANLYATNATIADTDLTYLYGITDTLANTTPPGASLAFTLLDTAPADSNFKGLSWSPTLPAGSSTITTSPSGLAVTTAGSGCTAGTYTTPVTLIWTPNSDCTLSVASPQGPTGTHYTLTEWQDGTTNSTDSVVAASAPAVYTATFSTSYQLSTIAGAGGTVSAGGYIPAGTDATVTATPDAGYYFVNFTGTTTSASNPLTFTVDGPQTITANFAPQIAPSVTWPTASAITYGQTLGSSLLSGGSAVDNNSTVFGTFAFTTSTLTPAAGTQAVSVTFTPADAKYSSVNGTVSVQVNQATPTITWPGASPLTFGQTLASSNLTGGSAISPITSANVYGAFAFASPTTAPPAGSSVQNVTFTPADTTDYVSVSGTVTVQVNPATPTVTNWPTGSAITYGQTLASSLLSGGTASTAGAFAFTNPAAVPPAGMQSESVTFTPGNLSQYSPVAGSVTVIVNKASTVTTLAVNPAKPSPHAPVTLLAAVTPAYSGTPSGTVSFYDGSTLLGTASLSAGPASLTLSGLPPGQVHQLTAVYSGDSNFLTSSSSPGQGKVF